MKRHLLPVLLLVAAAGLPTFRAQAQDKPVLNTAPPAPQPAQPRPVQPTPVPATAPEPAPTPEPTYNAPVQTTPDAPSGLDFPNRKATKAGGAEDKPPTKKFLYTNFGLGYSSYDYLNRFNVSLAPAIGYRITDKFAVGPGISYAYSSYSIAGNQGYPYTPDGTLTSNGASSVSTSSLGFKAFAQYIVYKEFFIHAEYEVTNAQLIFEGPSNYLFKQSKTVTTPLGGVGYRSYLGENAALDVVALYNFDNSIYSLYPGFNLRFSLLFNIGK
ncbi:hypothetical protein ACVWYF_000286 [Hymenobacter sp. UYAg731]